VNKGQPPHATPGPMRSDPGNARWCDEHARWECVKTPKRSDVCHGPRIAGLDACRMHAGVTGAVAKFQGEQRLALAEALQRAPHRHPAEVLLDCVHTADVLLVTARAEVQSGDVSAEALDGLRGALDQAARWAKATLDLDVASRENRAFEQVGAVYAAMFERVLDRAALPAEWRAAVTDALMVELQALPTGGG
jgi:hypothetical protein